MPNPTLEELGAAMQRHQALGENERMLDNPPEVRITRVCRECRSQLPVWRAGWSEIAAAVRKGEDIPDFTDQALCAKCGPMDGDES